MLRPIKDQCVGVWISKVHTCVYIYLPTCILNIELHRIRLVPELLESSGGGGGGGEGRGSVYNASVVKAND